MSTTKKLKQLIQQKQILLAPGVYDGLSARLAEQAGFKALYATGGGIARGAGFPDLGLLSSDEVAAQLRQIVEVTSIPIIADADTGYGNVLNVQRTFYKLEKIGIAGAHIEDQSFPKRCGHLDNKSLISTEEMQEKLKAARDVLTDDNFVLIARTDAIGVEGFAAAMDRAEAYVEAGADVLFIEAPQSVEQVREIAQRIKAPKLINMFFGGKTPMVPLEDLQSWGYSIMIVPSDLQRAAIFAMQQTLEAIKRDGNSQSVIDKMITFNEREKIVDTEKYLSLSDKFK